MEFYKPFTERVPDTQYQDRLHHILTRGIYAFGLPQGIDARTCFGTLPQMIFDLRNGVPLITERKIGSWKSAIAELLAFINGARDIDEIESFGCNKAFWSPYRGKGSELGVAPNDMGPGSYGGVFGHYERADGSTFNQFTLLLEQLREYPNLRSHRITNWRPDYTARGPNRKVIVAPCHGELHFRVLGEKLFMRMDQRSADFPIGVPHNMIQYAALHIMLCQVLEREPGHFVHSFSDAHVYENQVAAVKELLTRKPRPFPTLHLDPSVKDLFAFRIEHFELREYDPHPSLPVPYAP
jgi:thymidylate synthase